VGIVKSREIERLARKHLLPVLPGFVARGSLVYRRSFDYLLHAVSFGTSSFTSSRIYVSALIQPLYGPDDDLYLTYGFRLGNNFWDVDEDKPDPTFAKIAQTARRDALPFFDQVPDLDRFAEVVPKWAEATPRKIMQHHTLDDPAVAEDLAYTAILRGNKGEAIRLLEHAIESEREDGEYGNEERIANLEHILDLVQRLGLEAGQAQLEEWRRRTIRSLRLDP
jgi:hypothetical protein